MEHVFFTIGVLDFEGLRGVGPDGEFLFGVISEPVLNSQFQNGIGSIGVGSSLWEDEGFTKLVDIPCVGNIGASNIRFNNKISTCHACGRAALVSI